MMSEADCHAGWPGTYTSITLDLDHLLILLFLPPLPLICSQFKDR